MKEFGQIISSVIHRPHWLPIPEFILKTLLGAMSILVLEGQYVLPSTLLNQQFSFMYPTLQQALSYIFKK